MEGRKGLTSHSALRLISASSSGDLMARAGAIKKLTSTSKEDKRAMMLMYTYMNLNE